jgi:hypothetical protein
MDYTILFKKDLDDYKHVTAKVYNLWGTEYCRAYLTGLAMNTAGRVNENPMGFTLGAFRAINDLVEEHDRQFPQFKPNHVWDDCR